MLVVSAQRTPMTEEDAAVGLTLAWPEVDREQAALFLSLIWVETDHGDSCIRHNPGNLSAAETYPGMAWRPPWFTITEQSSERMQRLHQMMVEGRAPRAFRAYRSLEEGFADFARLLQTRPYEPLRREASTGDVARFRAELARRYSADYTPAHDRALAQFQRLFRPLVASQPAPSSSLPPLLASGGNGNAVLMLLALRALGA